MKALNQLAGGGGGFSQLEALKRYSLVRGRRYSKQVFLSQNQHLSHDRMIRQLH